MPNNLKIIFLLITSLMLCSLAAPLYAQSDSELQLFEGGNIRSDFGIRSHLLTGAGVRGAYGGLIAPLDPEPFVIFGNPAAITRIQGRKVIVSSSPSFEVDLTTITDPTTSIKTEVDDGLTSFKVTGPKTYPKLDGTFSRLGSFVSGFGVVLPLQTRDGRWLGGRIPQLCDYVAFGYTEPLNLYSNFLYNGLRMRIRTVDIDDNRVRHPENEILFYSSIKVSSTMMLTSDSWNLSVARKMGDYSLGMGLQRTAGRIDLHVNQRTDGIMSKAGIESSFNDPQSPWDDDYYFAAHGLFEGSALALRLGALYEPSDKFLLGAMLRLQGGMEMDADFGLELHTYRPMKMNAKEGEKQFDVNLIEDASEMTRTTEKVFETASTMDVSIPSELSVAASYTGSVKPSLTLTKYFGELSYKYNMTENGIPFTYKRGYKPNVGVKLSFDLFLLKFGFGAMQAVDVVGGYKDANGNPIPPAPAIWIPHAAFGFETGLSDALKLGVLLEGLPEDFLRLTLEYSL